MLSLLTPQFIFTPLFFLSIHMSLHHDHDPITHAMIYALLMHFKDSSATAKHFNRILYIKPLCIFHLLCFAVHVVSILSCCKNAFGILNLSGSRDSTWIYLHLFIDAIFIWKIYITFICQQVGLFKFNLIFEAWISKHTIVQHQSLVCIEMSFMEIDVRISVLAFSGSAVHRTLMSTEIQHCTEVWALGRGKINGPGWQTVPPTERCGVELRSRLSCKRSSSLSSQSELWAGRTVQHSGS